MTAKTRRTAKRSRGRSGSMLYRRIAQGIGRQIIRGTYAPGAVLPNEAAWCRIYAASRTAVREALKMLSAKGLVTSRPKVGSTVEPRENWNLLDRDVLAWHVAAMDAHAFLASVRKSGKFSSLPSPGSQPPSAHPPR